MQIDFTQPILNEKNEPYPDLTLRSVCVAACLAPLKGDESLPVEKKSAIGLLALQIQHSDSLDLRAEQVAMLKGRIAIIFANLVVYRAVGLLDPEMGEGSEAAPRAARKKAGAS